MGIKSAIKAYLTKKMIRVYRRDKTEILKPILKSITANWFINRKIIDFNTYLANHCTNIEILKSSEETLQYSDIPFYPYRTEDMQLLEEKGIRYASKLKDVKIIGGSSVIILNKKNALYDLKSQDQTNNIDFSDEGVVYHKNDDFYFLNSKISGNISNGIFILGNYSINYYHFLYEIIAKFLDIYKLDLDIKIPLLVDENLLNVPQYVEILNHFAQSRRVIPVGKDCIFEVENLYHFYVPNIIPPNFKDITKLKSSSVLIFPDSINFLRNHFFKLKTKQGGFNKRVFISRKNASERRAYNEVEIEQILKKYDFETYYPENLTIGQQIELFNNAEIIVGATGAAFSNIICCKPNCKVICFTNFAVNLTIFSTIAKLTDISLTYLYDHKLKLTSESDLHQAFQIEPMVLDSLLKSYLN